jgi:hypothetical protein
LRKTANKLLLIVSIVTFGLSVSSVLKYWDYEETLLDLSKILQSNISTKQLVTEIEASIKEDDFDDARMYLEIAQSHQYTLNYQKYQTEINQKDTQFKRISTQVANFSKGFIKGESSNMAGIAGSVSADFTVIGDARDLYREYGKHEKGEPVNELIVLLSGAGIGLTALTVGSLGSMAPAKAGASVIKVASKAQRLTLRFQKTLLKLGRKVFDWPAFTRLIKQDKSIANVRRAVKKAYHPEAVKPLKQIAGRVNSIRKSSSTVDAIHMLKYVETIDDLRHLEKVTVKYGTKTKGMMKLLGKGAIRTVRVLRKTTSLMLSIIGSVLSSLLSLFFMMTFKLT